MSKASQPQLVAVLFLLVATLAWPQGARAQDEPLDAPLAAMNACGPDAPGTIHFTLAATGDTFPHENIQAVGEAQGYDYLFDYLRPFLTAADLAYTNLDGAMLPGSPLSGYPAFNFSPRLAPALKNAGIDVVSTANNHILDRGSEGLDATLALLAQHGIAQHGAVSSTLASQPRPAYLPLTLSRDGATITVAFLSFTWGTNGIPDANKQVNLLYASNEYGNQGRVRPEVLAAVAQARREADLVVVATHWGFEYQFYPDSTQVEAARQIAAAGADLILGSQPHTLQPVEAITNGERTTLVFYSLANFLASQGPLQAEYWSATSAVVYVGIVRDPDGRVRLSGYRYLPTIHVDLDTRPAPIPAEGMDAVTAHVRKKLRDPQGLLEVAADPAALGSRVEVCPRLAFPPPISEAIGGDFARHYTTLGGAAPRDSRESLAVFGYPLGPPQQELASDCSRTLPILYTERQRLELHPEQPWPERVVGSLVGASIFRQRYGQEPVPRRDLAAADSFADERFRQFFERYGGLAVFGYPISGLLEEPAPDGTSRLVQYFERSRFELNPTASADDLLGQVVLGTLGREPGARPACAAVASVPQTTPQQDEVRRPPTISMLWTLLALGLLLIGALAIAAILDNRRRQQRYRQRAAARVTVNKHRHTPVNDARHPAPAGDDLLAELLSRPPEP